MNLIGNQRAIVFTAILAAFLIVWSGANWCSLAQNTQLPQPRGYVNDFADVIDAETKARLENILANLKQRTGIEFFIATVKSAGGEYLSDYSLRVANDWNLGPNSRRKGVVLVITTDDANFFTQLSGGVQTDLPDGLTGQMDRRMRPTFESAGYSQGLLTGIETFVNILGARNNFTFEALDQQPSENLIAQTRPRLVESPAPPPTETISSQPSDTPAPQPAASRTQTPAPNETPVQRPWSPIAPRPPRTPRNALGSISTNCVSSPTYASPGPPAGVAERGTSSNAYAT